MYHRFLVCSNIEDMAREAISVDVEEETLDSELIPFFICFFIDLNPEPQGYNREHLSLCNVLVFLVFLCFLFL